MAITFDAAGDRLSRTASMPNYNAAYTWCAWYYVIGAPAAARDTLGIDAGSAANRDAFETTTAPRMSLRINGGTITTFGPSPLSLNTWYFIGGRRNTATSIQAFVDTTFSAVDTTNVAARTAPTRMCALDFASSAVNARMAYMKLWTAALTDTELADEMQLIRPKRLDDLWGFWPLFLSADGADYSGNGRTWSLNGSLFTSDGPPVSYGAPIIVWPFVPVVGGTNFPKSVTGVLTPAGALVKRTTKTPAGALTPSGATKRTTGKLFAGSLTPAGALAAVKTTLLQVGGALAPAGATIKATAKRVTGTLTPAGALASVRHYARILTGALAPAGVLIKTISKRFAGSLLLSGVLSASQGLSIFIGGTLAPAGAVIRRTGKRVAGSLTPAGTLLRSIAKRLAGVLTPTGALTAVKGLTLLIGGTLAPAGLLMRRTGKQAAGALAPAGSLRRSIAKRLAGVLTPTGALVRSIGKRLAGALGLAGDLLREYLVPATRGFAAISHALLYGAMVSHKSLAHSVLTMAAVGGATMAHQAASGAGISLSLVGNARNEVA